MKTVDRVLVALLAIGVWGLVATNLLSFKVASAEPQREDYEIRQIIRQTIENCTVSGEVYLYSERYGEIESGSIDC